MAKIDDVAELLTEEVKNFKKTIKQIEEISKTIDNSTLKKDIAHLKGIVQTHNEHHLVITSNNNESVEKLINGISTKLEYPKWIIQIGIFVWLLFLVVFAYSLYRVGDMNELEIRAYEEGKSEMKQHYSDFVKDNPKVDKIYKDWIEKSEN